MPDDRDQRIRDRAYQLWEREGRPHGQHDEHWRRAAAEIEAEENPKAGTAAKPGKTPAPPTSAAEQAGATTTKPAKAADTPAKRTQGSEGKGDPQKTVATHAPGEKPKSSSGRTAGAATRQQGPGNEPADPRSAEAARRAPGEANPRAKPRRADAAVKSANNGAARE